MPRKAATKTTKKQKVVFEESEKRGTSFFDYLRFGESYTSLILGIIVVIIATALLLSFVHNKNTRNATPQATQQTQNTVQVSPKPNALAKSAPTGDINTAVSTGPVATTAPTAKPTVKPTMVVKIKPTSAPTKEIAKAKPAPTKAPNVKYRNDKNIWIVQKGESLWTIAEKKYTSGYNWVDIAKANKLADPSDIHAGDRLILPSVTPKQSTIATAQPTVTPTAAPAQQAAPGMSKITGKTYIVVKGDNLWNIAVRAYGDGYKWTAIANANHLVNPGTIHSGNKLIIPRS